MAGGLKNLDGITAAEIKATNAETQAESVTSEPSAPVAVLTWQAPSFSYKDKHFSWFLIAIVAVLALIGFFIYSQDWFSIAIVVIVSAVLFWYVLKVRPKDTLYSITEIGVNVDNHFYPFSEIHSYWIVYNENTKTLNIAFLKKYLPTLVIGLGETNPVLVKEALGAHIPEQEKRGENLVDRIIRTLGL